MQKGTKIFLVILVAIFVLGLFIKINRPFQNANTIPEKSNIPQTSKWLLPENFNGQPAWGIENGVIISTWPGNLGGIAGGGPKGLFRIYKGGEKGLAWVNFISIEPITQNSLTGFSELESILFVPNNYNKTSNPEQIIDEKLPQSYENLATITKENGVEQLNILFGIENSYINGAHVYITAHIREDKPDEIEFRMYAQKDSTEIKKIRLSSTAGNFNHLRILWLADKTLDARDLYPNYKETGKRDFALWTDFKFGELAKSFDGSLIVATTRSEDDPGQFWNDYFTKYQITQYWKKYPGSFDGDEFSSVNAKYVFWHNGEKIPGGVSYENFELNSPIFEQGQKVWFGATEKTPNQLGLKKFESTPN